MESVISYLETLIRETKKSEAEVMAAAFRIGMRQLWRERILGRYLQGGISRNEAIEAVGIDLVDLAERQKKAIIEDMEWALGE